MKILSVGAELFRADGQTDMTKLIAVFRHFAKALKNERIIVRLAIISPFVLYGCKTQSHTMREKHRLRV
jgi:hypothetical protein